MLKHVSVFSRRMDVLEYTYRWLRNSSGPKCPHVTRASMGLLRATSTGSQLEDSTAYSSNDSRAAKLRRAGIVALRTV